MHIEFVSDLSTEGFLNAYKDSLAEVAYVHMFTLIAALILCQLIKFSQKFQIELKSQNLKIIN